MPSTYKPRTEAQKARKRIRDREYRARNLSACRLRVRLCQLFKPFMERA